MEAPAAVSGGVLSFAERYECGGHRTGEAVGVKHSVSFVLIPKTLLVTWLPGKLAFKGRICQAYTIAQPTNYCSHDKFINWHLKYNLLDLVVLLDLVH